MNRHFRLIAGLLVCLSVSRVAIAQDESTLVKEHATTCTNSVQTENIEGHPSQDFSRADQENIVGQGLFPNIYQGFGQGIGIWKFMFPALGMLFNWAGTLPAQQLLGVTAPDPFVASGSRVVLVLAEDNKSTRSARDNSEIVSDSAIEQTPTQDIVAQSNAGADMGPFAQIWQTLQQNNLNLGHTSSLLSQGVPRLNQRIPMLEHSIPTLGQMPSIFEQALQTTSLIDQAVQGLGQSNEMVAQSFGQVLPPSLQQTQSGVSGQSYQGPLPISLYQLIGGNGASANPTVGSSTSTPSGEPVTSDFSQESIEGQPLAVSQDVAAEVSQASDIQSPDQSIGSTLSRYLSGGWPQDPGQMLGQVMQQPGFNIDWSQNPGQVLGSVFQSMPTLPHIDFPQASDQIVGSALQQQGINIDLQSNPAGQILSQAFQGQLPFVKLLQPSMVGVTHDGSMPMQNIQTMLDNGNTMLSSTLQQQNQQLSSLFGFKPYQTMQPVENPIDADASEISEVHISPNGEAMTINIDQSIASPTARTPSEKMFEMRMKAAMQEANKWKTMPVLWFRLPEELKNYSSSAGCTQEEQKMQSQLLDFERKVVQELLLLQEIERQAQELRAATKDDKYKDLPYKLNYPLTNTPVYKITREDIEKAMHDDYVQKLLQKAAERCYISVNKNNSEIDAEEVIVKRQAFSDSMDANTPLKHLTKEDIAKMMAYAHRLANANSQPAPLMAREDMTDSKTTESRQWLERHMASQQQQQQQQQRQWIADQQHDEQRQWIESKMAQMMIDEQLEQRQRTNELMERQRTEQAQMQRQWIEEQHRQQLQEVKMLYQHQMPRRLANHQEPLEKTQIKQEWVDQQQQPTHSPFKMDPEWTEPNKQTPPNPIEMNRQWVEPQKQSPEINQHLDLQTEKHKAWLENQQQAPEIQAMVKEHQNTPAMQRQWSEENHQITLEKAIKPEKSTPMQVEQMQQRQWMEQQQQQYIDLTVQPEKHPGLWFAPNPQQNIVPPMMTQISRMPELQKPLITNTHGINSAREVPKLQQHSMMQQQPKITPQSVQLMPRQMDLTDHYKDGADPMIHVKSLEQEKQLLLGVAEPQISEHGAQPRFKGLFDDLLSDFGGHGGSKKKKNKERPTIINYYYNTGGSKYPSYDGGYSSDSSYGGSQGNYGGSYGGESSSYGSGYGSSYGGGHGRGHGGGSGGGYNSGGSYSNGSYGGRRGGYGDVSNYSVGSSSYKSDGYSSIGFDNSGAYRTAVGNDEIEKMLRQHKTPTKLTQSKATQPMMKIRQKTTTLNSQVTSTERNDYKMEKSTTPPSSVITVSFPTDSNNIMQQHLHKDITPISELSSDDNDVDAIPTSQILLQQNPEIVGFSLFSFDEKMLKPFMGIRSTKHQYDPWLYKPYNRHRPLYLGGGSFESYFREGRYKRDTSESTINILTPGMLNRLLRLKVDFQKKFPQLYKTMLDQLHDSNRTKIRVKPPLIPTYVAYPPMELGAAEKCPEEETEQEENIKSKIECDDFVDYFHFNEADGWDGA